MIVAFPEDAMQEEGAAVRLSEPDMAIVGCALDDRNAILIVQRDEDVCAVCLQDVVVFALDLRDDIDPGVRLC